MALAEGLALPAPMVASQNTDNPRLEEALQTRHVTNTDYASIRAAQVEVAAGCEFR